VFRAQLKPMPLKASNIHLKLSPVSRRPVLQRRVSVKPRRIEIDTCVRYDHRQEPWIHGA
jgi:hypothetical protein